MLNALLVERWDTQQKSEETAGSKEKPSICQAEDAYKCH